MVRKRKASPNANRIYWIAGAVAIILVFAYLYWRLVFTNINQWTHSSMFGIRLPMRFEIHGIDVSKFQGDIQWKKVANVKFPGDIPLRFVFVKATEGATLTDRKFKQNFSEAKKSGFVCGAYHFYIPWRDPVAQADNFVKNVKLNKGDLAPVLDIEVNALRPDREIIKDLQTWLRLVEKHYGIKPIIYTNQHFYFKFVKGNLDDYPLWIADYSKETLSHYPESQLHFWQHSKAGWIPGIKGKVDFNVFVQSESDFESLRLEE